MDSLTHALSEIPWYSYMFFGLALLALAVTLTVGLREHKRAKELDRSQQQQASGGAPAPQPPVRKKIEHPVIGYKNANIEDISLDADDRIVDIKLVGLMGTSYGIEDKTNEDGKFKFNMYNDVSKALEHKQEWGSTLLEAVGYGEVEAHELGYTSQHQRVLQLVFLNCSTTYTDEIRCKNSADYLARETEGKRLKNKPAYRSGYKTYCAGCIKGMSSVIMLEHYYNKSFGLNSGHTVVIADHSTREDINLVPTVLNNEDNGDGGK